MLAKKVSEEYAELYHYTGEAGLRGIIESQQLWATNFAYLNDAEEHVGFFEHRFPVLLERAIRRAVGEVAQRPEAKKKIDADGGVDVVVAGLKAEMAVSFRNAALKLNQPFIASFCGSKVAGADTDGLLSQWRGYGTSGGYCIVFRAKELEAMIDAEAQNFHYQFGLFADVDYGDGDDGRDHPERAELEADLENAVVQSLLTDEPPPELAVVLATLSCRYKHWGFKEEAEVRMVVMPTNEDVYRMAHAAGDKRLRKPILFRTANGGPIPYIALFGQLVGGVRERLPISKVLVGPHPEKLKRQKAVEALLREYGIQGEVVVSTIPYLGR